MMVIFSVNLKMAFIDAGSDNGEIIDAKHLKSLIAVRKRFLKSDVELAPIRLFSDAENVSAEINDCALHAGIQKLILDTIYPFAIDPRSIVVSGERNVRVFPERTRL